MRPIEEALQFDPSTIFPPLSHFCNLIPVAAELFVSIFNSFEAGIGNAISSFKWWKNYLIFIWWKIDIDFQNWIIGLTKHLPKTYQI